MGIETAQFPGNLEDEWILKKSIETKFLPDHLSIPKLKELPRTFNSSIALSRCEIDRTQSRTTNRNSARVYKTLIDIPQSDPSIALETRFRRIRLSPKLHYRELESRLSASPEVWGRCRPHSCLRPRNRVSRSLLSSAMRGRLECQSPTLT